MNIDTSALSRVTLVDETGRVYERMGLSVTLSIQDSGRTLKVFVKRREQASSDPARVQSDDPAQVNGSATKDVS